VFSHAQNANIETAIAKPVFRGEESRRRDICKGVRRLLVLMVGRLYAGAETACVGVLTAERCESEEDYEGFVHLGRSTTPNSSHNHTLSSHIPMRCRRRMSL